MSYFNEKTIFEELLKNEIIKFDTATSLYIASTLEGIKDNLKREDILNIYCKKHLNIPHLFKYKKVLSSYSKVPFVKILSGNTPSIMVKNADIILKEVENNNFYKTSPYTTYKRMYRGEYHSISRKKFDDYLNAIPYDSDDIRRSYGLEYEIYHLNEWQTHCLTLLTPILPYHIVEKDGSLGYTGLEMIFAPMDREYLKATVNILHKFVKLLNIDMQNTGMHITYGLKYKDNDKQQLAEDEGTSYQFSSSTNNIQLRLNRLIFTLCATATHDQLVSIFGRTFNNYALMPSRTSDWGRYLAMTNSNRKGTVFEFRLPKYNCKIDKVVEFLKLTDFVYERGLNKDDLLKIYDFVKEV